MYLRNTQPPLKIGYTCSYLFYMFGQILQGLNLSKTNKHYILVEELHLRVMCQIEDSTYIV